MAIDEIAPRLPAALHGFPIRTLLGWAREPIMAPNAEIREALRNQAVLDALRVLSARAVGGRHFDRKVVA